MERNWKFGMNQYGQQTPRVIAVILNVWSAIATVLMGWMPTAPFISHKVQDIATPLLALSIGICQAIKPFFGKQPEPPSYSAPNDDELQHKP